MKIREIKGVDYLLLFGGWGVGFAFGFALGGSTGGIVGSLIGSGVGTYVSRLKYEQRRKQK